MYARSRDQAEGVARELAASYQVNAAAFACDITDGAAVKRLVGDVSKRFGRIDILVNDAAYNTSIPFTDLDNLTEDVWDKIMAVNLTGPMRLTKAVAPVMKAQGRGRIVNISSVAGLGPQGSSHRLCGVEGGAHSPHALHRRWHAGAARRSSTAWRRGSLEGTRADIQSAAGADRARARRPRSLKKAADKDDCADMVVTMCAHRRP